MQFTTRARACRVSPLFVALSIAGALMLGACGDNGNAPAKEAADGATPPLAAQTYAISGAVSGLTGQGLILKNNAGDDLPIAADGNFTFPTSLASGSAYAVTVGTQPTSPAQTCTVNHASGAVGSSNVTDVVVLCATNAFSVGGAVSGLLGSGLVLQNNGGDDLAVSATGAFAFPGAVASGAAYAVTIKTQPTMPSQVCSVTSGSGTIGNASVSDVAISCTSPMPRFALVTNTASNTVSPNYASTPDAMTPVGSTESTGMNPTAIVATPDGRFAYVANFDDNDISGYQVGPTGWLTAVPAARVPAGARPSSLTVDPAGRILYAANQADDTISAFTIDVAGNLVGLPGSPYAAGDGPVAMALSPNGKFLYTVNYNNGTVSGHVVDPVTGVLTGQVPGSPMILPGAAPRGIAIDPTSSRAYVSSTITHQVYSLSIDGTTGELALIDTDLAGTEPWAIAIHPSGKFLYTANFIANTVSVFSVNAATGNLNVIGTVPGFPSAINLAMDAAGQYLYVNSFSSNQLFILSIDQTTGVPALASTTGSRGVNPRGLAIISQ